jgi:hypothetical protein
VELVRAAIVFAEGQGWNLSQLIRLRLKAVKDKFIHHSRV